MVSGGNDGEKGSAIPKARLDAITDGVFAFAMTLLVLDLRLPEGLVVHSNADLLDALSELSSQYLAYVISFFVLGLRWLAQASERGVPEITSAKYGRWVLVYLFFITSIPFSTMVVGRYEDSAPANWLYAANLILSALASLRMAYLAEEETDRTEHHARPELATLIGSAVLSIILSFIIPSYATLAYALNVVPPIWRRWQRPRSDH